jgi:hypothetical protein
MLILPLGGPLPALCGGWPDIVVDFPFYIIDHPSIYSQDMIAAYSVSFFNKNNKSLTIYLPRKGCRMTRIKD